MNEYLPVVLIAILLPLTAMFGFRKAGHDYRRDGRLSRTSSALQVAVFILHAASSYVLLDSRPGSIDTRSPLFGFALLLIAGGIILLVTTLGRFGVRRAIGQETPSLTCSGVYRRSRNPQVMFYGMAVVGYSLLWPSWTGVLWIILYAVLAQMMVRTEEQHLKRTFGTDYVDYCTRTPRYMDLPGMK